MTFPARRPLLRTSAAGALLAMLLLILGLGPSAGSADAKVYAPEMRGTFTVIERSDHTEFGTRTDHLARVRWRMPGKLIYDRPITYSYAIANVLEYRNHTTVAQGEDGLPGESDEQFAGFVKQDGEPLGATKLQVIANSINPRLKRARVSILLPGMEGPGVRINTTYSRIPGVSPDTRWLVSDPRAGIEAGTGAILGVGAVRTKASGESTMSPVEVMSAHNVLMRYQRGRWRAKGQRTINGHYWTGAPVTYTVKWNLVSRQPTRTCSGIPSRIVRGKTTRQARAIIRKAGFRPWRVKHMTSRSTSRGRVVTTSAASATRCGAKVDMYVRR